MQWTKGSVGYIKKPEENKVWWKQQQKQKKRINFEKQQNDCNECSFYREIDNECFKQSSIQCTQLPGFRYTDNIMLNAVMQHSIFTSPHSCSKSFSLSPSCPHSPHSLTHSSLLSHKRDISVFSLSVSLHFAIYIFMFSSSECYSTIEIIESMVGYRTGTAAC